MKGIVLVLLAALLPAVSLAAELGDDGLHKTAWMQDTFKDLREDLADANNQGKRLMVIVEQRGCVYCTKMHEEVFPQPEIEALLTERYFVVQINMFGDVEVTDFDGETLTEKKLARKWGLLFTPTLIFFPEDVEEGATGPGSAVATMPGAFSKQTTFDLLNWVLELGYDSDESFQKYHSRKLEERNEDA
jgi:thioredoxin-related protein